MRNLCYASCPEAPPDCPLISTVHDPDFRVSFQDFTTFTEKVSEKIIEADETIPELPVKDVVSVNDWVGTSDTANEHRFTEFTEVSLKHGCSWTALTTQDIRFSKDPTPYKVRKHFDF